MKTTKNEDKNVGYISLMRTGTTEFVTTDKVRILFISYRIPFEELMSRALKQELHGMHGSQKLYIYTQVQPQLAATVCVGKW